VASLERVDVGAGDRLVVLQREEEGDIDVDALGQERPDGGLAFLGSRNLDHQVRPVDRLPEDTRVLERSLGVPRKAWKYLDGDEAVLAAALVVDRAKDVAGVLDVLDGDGLEDLRRILALGEERLDVGIVG